MPSNTYTDPHLLQASPQKGEAELNLRKLLSQKKKKNHEKTRVQEDNGATI
jgi:hypothetical protein